MSIVLHSQSHWRNTTRVPCDGGAECLLLESCGSAFANVESLWPALWTWRACSLCLKSDIVMWNAFATVQLRDTRAQDNDDVIMGSCGIQECRMMMSSCTGWWRHHHAQDDDDVIIHRMMIMSSWTGWWWHHHSQDDDDDVIICSCHHVHLCLPQIEKFVLGSVLVTLDMIVVIVSTQFMVLKGLWCQWMKELRKRLLWLGWTSKEIHWMKMHDFELVLLTSLSGARMRLLVSDRLWELARLLYNYAVVTRL